MATELNSEKRFLAFQIILYDEDFSEYVKNFFKMQDSDNQMAKTLSIMNMIEMLFMNIDILRIKEWDNFMFTIRLASPRMMVYKLQLMVTSVLDGNVFLVARALSTNTRNIFSLIEMHIPLYLLAFA